MFWCSDNYLDNCWDSESYKKRSIKAFQHIVFDDKWGVPMCWRIMAASTCFSVLMYFIINAIG